MREQRGWVAAQEEASQERRVGDKECRDSAFTRKGHCPAAPKQEGQGRFGDVNWPKPSCAADESVGRKLC